MFYLFLSRFDESLILSESFDESFISKNSANDKHLIFSLKKFEKVPPSAKTVHIQFVQQKNYFYLSFPLVKMSGINLVNLQVYRVEKFGKYLLFLSKKSIF